MTDQHLFFAVLGSSIGIIGYVLYLRSVFSGSTKPHIFTWLIYAFIDSIIFVIQILEGGGPGAWVTSIGVIGNTVIALSCIRSGERKIAVSDWISFLSALLGIVLWRMTDNPLLAVCVITVTNTLAVFPTLRKSFRNPYEESVTIWGLDVLRSTFGLFALSSFTLTTSLFPIGVLLTNSTLIGVIMVRRYVMGKKT